MEWLLACAFGISAGVVATGIFQIDFFIAAVASYSLGILWLPLATLALLAHPRTRPLCVRRIPLAASFALGQLLVRSHLRIGSDVQLLYTSVVPVLVFLVALLAASLAALVRARSRNQTAGT